MEGARLWDRFLDIIYPRDIRCSICNEKKDYIASYGICKDCENNLPFILDPTCSRCGKPMLDNKNICSDCLKINHAFSQGMSVFEFGAEIRGLIHRYKYDGQKYLSDAMIRWMAKGLSSKSWDFDIIVPVPLHRTRQRQRGFNQAALLAKGLARETDVPIVENILLRVKNTPHQALLNRHERQQNLMEAFDIKEGRENSKVFQDKIILLVDDVYTTGSTAHQCGKVLLKSGAKKVYVITLATGTDP